MRKDGMLENWKDGENDIGKIPFCKRCLSIRNCIIKIDKINKVMPEDKHQMLIHKSIFFNGFWLFQDYLFH
jgi:hypothetical protein